MAFYEKFGGDDTSELLEDHVEDLLSFALPPQVWRQYLAFPDDLVDGPVDPVSADCVPLEAKHERRGTDRRQGVGDALALNIWRGPVDAAEVWSVRTS